MAVCSEAVVQALGACLAAPAAGHDTISRPRPHGRVVRAERGRCAASTLGTGASFSTHEGGHGVTVKLAAVTVDCEDALTVARFWSAALGRPLDPNPSSEFASIGMPEHRDTRGWHLGGNPTCCSPRCPSGRPPRIACTSIWPLRIEKPRSPDSLSWAPHELPTWTSGATSGRSCKIRKATSSALRRPDERREPAGSVGAPRA
jgi:hypothetical protein